MSARLTCQATGALLPDYLEGLLPLGPRLQVKLHCHACPPCRALLATLRALPQVVGRALTPEGDCQARGQEALQGALARLKATGALRQEPQALRNSLQVDGWNN